MVKIQKLPNGQLVITIPKQIALLKQLDKGSIISFQDVDKDSMLIKIARGENVKKPWLTISKNPGMLSL